MSCLMLSVVAALTLGPSQQATPSAPVVTFADGFVSVSATDAPAADVLSAWAGAGHTDFVGIERLAGHRVTIALQRVSDTVALDEILGPENGFVAVFRTAVSPSLSMFSRVVIGAPTPRRRAAATPPIPELIYDYTVPPMAGSPAPDGDLAAGLTPTRDVPEGTPAPQPELAYEYVLPAHARDVDAHLPVTAPVVTPAPLPSDYLPPELRFEYVLPLHAHAPAPSGAPKKPNSGSDR
jgi:hypothetical protein